MLQVVCVQDIGVGFTRHLSLSSARQEASCDIAGCRNGHTAEAVCLEVKDDRDESESLLAIMCLLVSICLTPSSRMTVTIFMQTQPTASALDLDGNYLHRKWDRPGDMMVSVMPWLSICVSR